MSYTDKIFKDTCNRILNSGYNTKSSPVRPHWEDGAPAYTFKEFGIINEYDLRKDFPALTLRPTALKSATDEILWIWQKNSNNVNDLSSHIWDSWANKDGTIGKAYGWQVGHKLQIIFTTKEKLEKVHPNNDYIVSKDGATSVNQIDYIIHEIMYNENSRRIIGNLYNIEDLDAMNLHPCCYSVTFNVCGDTLNMLLNQRSNDVLVANNWNVSQYAILLMMIAQVTGKKAGKLIHVIADAHIYDRHVDIIKELCNREEYDAPTVRLNPDIKNFYDFTTDDIIVDNYNHNDQIKNIPVAI